MATIIQRSFSGGEIHPRLYPRCDMSRFFTSLKLCRNAFIQHQGGASNRAGSLFVGPAKNTPIKLVDFIFSDNDAYSLEIGDEYMRVVKNGSYIMEAAQNVTALTDASPAVFTIVGHGYSDGNLVYLSGFTGDLGLALNNRYGIITNSATDTFQITFPEGIFNSTPYAAWSSGGSATKVYEIATPWAGEDLKYLYYDQSADVITFVHRDYPVVEVTRFDDDNWVLEYADFQPSVPRGSIAGISKIGTANTYYVKITGIGMETGEESYPFWYLKSSISGITQASPAVVTHGSTDLEEGDLVTIQGVLGMIFVNGGIFKAKNVTATTCELYHIDGVTPVDTTGFPAYSSGGSIYTDYLKFTSNTIAASNVAIYTWSYGSVIPVREFNIYRRQGQAAYGLVGIAPGDAFQFRDVGIDPDTTITPPIYSTPFRDVDTYPGTLCYYQQRRLFARPNENWEKVTGSQIANYNNFSASSPLQDDDSFSFALRGKRYTEIRHMVDNGSLIIFTANDIWNAKGDVSGVITPSQVNAVRQSYIGSAYLEPIVVDDIIVFLQARGNKVRGLNFDFSTDSYRGNELSIFASHLLEGYEIIDWCYQETPDSILWIVRSDGVMLGMTFVREQNVIAWHRHDMKGGRVESVCCIPEGDRDVVYMIVSREINGVDVKYHERLSSRFISPAQEALTDMKFLDSYLTYDGRNTNDSLTIELSGGSTWDNGEPLNMEASGSIFTALDVGNEFQLWTLDDNGDKENKVTVVITAYVDPQNVTVNPVKLVPVPLRTGTHSTWAKAVDEISGLWHLEGEEVSVQGDGFVVASPYNSAYPTVTVENGQITLDECYAVIHVGLPYISDIQTLSPDTTQSETTIDKAQLFAELTLFVEKTNSFWAGPDLPEDDDTDALEDMRELTTRDQNTDPDSYPELITKAVTLNINGQFKPDGSIVVRQVDPAPLSVQAIAPSGYVPIGGE